MPASDAGAALIAGRVPVAVTYEPYLTLAMQQNDKVKMIYSAGEDPGLISDVFVVREEFLNDKPGPDRRAPQGLGQGARRLPRRPDRRPRHHLGGGRRQAGGARYRLRRRRLLFARREQERACRQLRQEGHTGGSRGREEGGHPAEGCGPRQRDRRPVRGCRDKIGPACDAGSLPSAAAFREREFLGVAALVFVVLGLALVRRDGDRAHPPAVPSLARPGAQSTGRALARRPA